VLWGEKERERERGNWNNMMLVSLPFRLLYVCFVTSLRRVRGCLLSFVGKVFQFFLILIYLTHSFVIILDGGALFIYTIPTPLHPPTFKLGSYSWFRLLHPHTGYQLLL
jgi:hypothetical protein